MSINVCIFLICWNCLMIGFQTAVFMDSAKDGRFGLSLFCISIIVISALLVWSAIIDLKKAVGRS